MKVISATNWRFHDDDDDDDDDDKLFLKNCWPAKGI